MLRARRIRQDIFWVGALDPDRKQFDALTPLPEGTSYNSYLVRGSEQVALIDTVEPTKLEELFSRLDSIGVNRIDYLISNHAEQDHSGSIPAVLQRFPEARVLCSPKAARMLEDLLHLPASRFEVVQDGATVSLGDRQLRFLHAPWVHWPETMMTYLPEEQLLFSCDLFGSHIATHDLLLNDRPRIQQGAKRYYAEIMSPFRTQIRKHLQTLASLPISLIAPSHGPLHVQPEFILELYREWSQEEPAARVLIAYTSMHGSTKAMVDHLAETLIAGQGQVEVLNLEEVDIGALSMAILDAAVLVLACPMVLAGPHPKAAYAAALINAQRPKIKHAAVIGSFGWGGKLVEPLVALLDRVKAEFLNPVLAQGHPRAATFAELDRLAAEILERLSRISAAQ